MPLIRAGFWIAIYLAVVTAPLVVLVIAPGPGSVGFWWDLSIALGFAGLVMMGVQFLLTARFRGATAPFGIDVIYYFHRYMAYLALVALLAHPVILLVANPALVPYLNPFGAPAEIAAGTGSLVLLLLLVVSSIGRKKLGISYDAWRVSHLVLAVGCVSLAFGHMWGIGYYSTTPAVMAVWVAIGLSLVVVVVRVRVVRPWKLMRTPYRVDSVRKELGSAWTVTLEPEGHPGFGFDPGQFGWVTLRSSPFSMKEHPFSIASASSDDGTVEFTIKELGDFTSTVGDIRPGERAYVDGPYGAFSTAREPGAAGYVFVAGGIGIAPIASMLRALADAADPRPVILIASHQSWDRLPLREGLSELHERLDLTVIHVLEETHPGWSGDTGRVTPELLGRVLPPAGERGKYGYFVCGPAAMNQAVREFLKELGVPGERVHTELFDLV